MPFDAQDPRLGAVAMIDAVLDYLGPDGERWYQGGWHRRDQRCLLGTMAHLRAVRHVKGDATRKYLLAAFRERRLRSTSVIAVNDCAETTFDDVRGMLLTARAIALADIEGRPRPAAERPKRSPVMRQTHFEAVERIKRQIAELLETGTIEA
ncbi:MAG TPA: hypothetical protein VME92_14130 [Acetobacteraceae bacterium]|nr:hypothetical protein [Acetobacteraceae bacterium]